MPSTNPQTVLNFAKKRRVKLAACTAREAERLRADAGWAYLDGRNARSRDLNAVASKVERFLEGK